MALTYRCLVVSFRSTFARALFRIGGLFFEGRGCFGSAGRTADLFPEKFKESRDYYFKLVRHQLNRRRCRAVEGGQHEEYGKRGCGHVTIVLK